MLYGTRSCIHGCGQSLIDPRRERNGYNAHASPPAAMVEGRQVLLGECLVIAIAFSVDFI